MAASRRRAAIQDMFRLVEAKYGDFSSLARPLRGRDPVLVVPTLTRDALADLFSHRVAAVRVPGFYPADSAALLAARMRTDPAIARQNWQISVAARGLESTDVTAAGGTPHNVAAGDASGAALEKYFDSALPAMRQLRRMDYAAPSSSSSPPPPPPPPPPSSSSSSSSQVPSQQHSFLPPIDQLRLELDEVWPEGATVAKDKATGRAHMAGIGRIVHGPTQWERGFCHADDLGVMSVSSGTFSANVYLQMPQAPGGATAGALSIWDIQIDSRWDFYRHAHTLSQLTAQCEEGQERLRAVLPPPLTIVPDVGDLVLLCVQRPHAVDGFRAGTRVSQQCFLSVDKGDPIRLDS